MTDTTDFERLRPAVKKTQIVVECTACEYRRTYESRSRRVSGAVSGHAREASCETGAVVREETILVCDSCGYADGEKGAAVDATDTDPRYEEDTLCNVCRAHRDEIAADAMEWAFAAAEAADN